MYKELGSVKEPVALSVQEALDSASALLVQQGYEISQRTETSLTVVRRRREGLFGHSLQNLTVFVRSLPEGGVRILLRGNDEEGVRERLAEWSRWAEGLPKRGQDQQERRETPQGVARSESRGMGTTEGPTPEATVDPQATRSPHEGGQREESAVGAVPEPESSPEGAIGDGERHPSPKDPGRWATVASWGREPRVAAGKQAAEPVSPQEGPSAASRIPGVDKGTYEGAPASDTTLPKVVEAQSFRLVNEDGEPRAVLGLDGDAPYLKMMGTGGESRVVFRLNPEDGEPTLALRDSSGNIRVYVGLSNSGPNVALMDDAGNIRAKLGVGRQATADGVTPSLDFIDENGEVRLKIFQYDGNEPVMLFLNENGGTSLILREQEGSPALGLLDKFGKTRGVFQLGPDGSPTLIIKDEHGRAAGRLP